MVSAENFRVQLSGMCYVPENRPIKSGAAPMRLEFRNAQPKVICEFFNSTSRTCKILQSLTPATPKCIFSPLLTNTEKKAEREPKIITYSTPDIDLTFTVDTRKVIINGNPTPKLTPTEGTILKILLNNRGNVILENDLYAACHPGDGNIYTPSDKGAIRNHIHKLRKKIDKEKKLIHNTAKSGYYIDQPPQA